MLDKALFRAGVFAEAAGRTIEERGVAAPCSTSDVSGLCGRDGRVCVPCALRAARQAYGDSGPTPIPAAELAEALTLALEAARAHRIPDRSDAAYLLHRLAVRLQDAAVTTDH